MRRLAVGKLLHWRLVGENIPQIVEMSLAVEDIIPMADSFVHEQQQEMQAESSTSMAAGASSSDECLRQMALQAAVANATALADENRH